MLCSGADRPTEESVAPETGIEDKREAGVLTARWQAVL